MTEARMEWIQWRSYEMMKRAQSKVFGLCHKRAQHHETSNEYHSTLDLKSIFWLKKTVFLNVAQFNMAVDLLDNRSLVFAPKFPQLVKPFARHISDLICYW